MENDIKVVVFGQVNHKSEYVYTFPDRFDPMHPTSQDDWLRSVIDPSDSRVFGCAEVFTMWKSKQGNFYGIIVPSPDNPGQDRRMLAIFTGKQKVTDTMTLVHVLRDLSQLVILADIQDDSQVEILLNPLVSILEEDSAEPIKANSFQKNYCTFESDEDVAQVFEFIGHKTYSESKRLLIVPTSAVNGIINGYKEIEKVQPEPEPIHEPEAELEPETEEIPVAEQELSEVIDEPEVREEPFVTSPDDSESANVPEPEINDVAEEAIEEEISTEPEKPEVDEPEYNSEEETPIYDEESYDEIKHRSDKQRTILLVIIAVLVVLLIASIITLIIVIQQYQNPQIIYI